MSLNLNPHHKSSLLYIWETASVWFLVQLKIPANLTDILQIRDTIFLAKDGS